MLKDVKHSLRYYVSMPPANFSVSEAMRTTRIGVSPYSTVKLEILSNLLPSIEQPCSNINNTYFFSHLLRFTLQAEYHYITRFICE